MFGLGKPRSKFGKFVDSNGISHGELVKQSGVSKDTVTKACSDDNYPLREITMNALVTAVRRITGKLVYKDDFWTIDK